MLITKDSKSLIIETRKGKILTSAFNVHIFNKIDLLIKDLLSLSEADPEFEDFLFDMYDDVSNFNFDEKKYIDQTLKFSEKFIDIYKIDINKFCDTSKKTQNSLYFDKEEIKSLLIYIGALKIFSIIINTDNDNDIKYKSPILIKLYDRFKDVLDKIFMVIKSKLMKVSNWQNQLKLVTTDEYLVLTNFSFIVFTILVYYNWDNNPLSFIVSIASDNINYFLMSINQNSVQYSTELETVSDNFLETLSYESVLLRINKKLKDVFSDSNQKINYELYPTQLTEFLSLPLISMLLDINISYLRQKSIYDKIDYQYLAYTIIKNNADLKKLCGTGLKLFLFLYQKPINSTTLVSSILLESLKSDVVYYGVDNKIPVIDLLQKLSTLIHKKTNLRHIINSSQFNETGIKQMAKDLSNFLVNILDDKKRSSLIESGKKTVIELYLKDTKAINTSELLQQL